MRARAAVLEAGRIAMRLFRQPHESWEKGPGQIVTEADIAVDRFLHAALCGGAATAWLSEETEDDRSRLDGRGVWVVDPIDGTRSFADGVAEFTICVALLARTAGAGLRLQSGDRRDCSRRYWAGRHLNGAPMRASEIASLDDARIVASRFESRRRDFAALVPTAALSSLGSLAYKLALVAAGRYDGYLSWRRTNDWDIAAAVLLLEEAGAGSPMRPAAPIRLNRPRAGPSGAARGRRPLFRRCSPRPPRQCSLSRRSSRPRPAGLRPRPFSPPPPLVAAEPAPRTAPQRAETPCRTFHPRACSTSSS